MTGIAEMFAALAGADRYEMQLELWCFSRAAMRSEYLKDWRSQNRERVRAYEHARRPPKPRRIKAADECCDCARPAVPGRRSCAAHLEANRIRTAARKAARKAA